jgi:hypothetical protein
MCVCTVSSPSLFFFFQEFNALDRSYNDLMVKCSAMEKRILRADEEATSSAQMYKDYEDLKEREKKQTKEFEEAMDVLVSESERYQKENVTLKKQLLEGSSKGDTRFKSPEGPSPSSSSSSSGSLSFGLPVEVSSMRKSLIYYQQVASQAVCDSLSLSLTALPPLPTITTAFGAKISSSSAISKVDGDHKKLKRELQATSHSVIQALSTCRLVDLTAKEVAPQHQILAVDAQVKYLRESLSALQRGVGTLATSHTSISRGRSNTPFHDSYLVDNTVSTELNQLRDSTATLLSRITVNSNLHKDLWSSSSEGQRRQVFVTDGDMIKLHNAILSC